MSAADRHAGHGRVGEFSPVPENQDEDSWPQLVDLPGAGSCRDSGPRAQIHRCHLSRSTEASPVATSPASSRLISRPRTSEPKSVFLRHDRNLLPPPSQGGVFARRRPSLAPCLARFVPVSFRDLSGL